MAVKWRTTNIIPVMGLEQLKEGYQKILIQIYSPAPYYRRIRTILREYRPSHMQFRFRFCHVLAIYGYHFRKVCEKNMV